jgi:hypothetical protein
MKNVNDKRKILQYIIICQLQIFTTEDLDLSDAKEVKRLSERLVHAICRAQTKNINTLWKGAEENVKELITEYENPIFELSRLPMEKLSAAANLLKALADDELKIEQM